MGLKLKWFRRRITFEGIPSAPERSIRRKEQNSGITVIGVYRQSVNFEDYIEPSRASYWNPPSHPIVTTTIRKQNTSTTSSSIANKSSLTEKHSAGDKITREHNNGRIIVTPPEPSYTPPEPPSRRGLSKTKSTPNISVLERVSSEPTSPKALEVTRSVEVLNEVTVEKCEVPFAPAPRTVGINYNVEVQVDAEEQEDAGAAIQKDEGRKAEQWQDQQPEFFNDILEKVNGLANTTKPMKTDYGDDSETESFDDIFEKVKAKQRTPAEHPTSPSPEMKMGNPLSKSSRNTSSSSIEDIFEPRPPQYSFSASEEEQFTKNDTPQPEVTPKTPEPEPRQLEVESSNLTNNPDEAPPLRSILKKRAPAPPQLKPPHSVELTPTEIPTPPPRAIRQHPETIPKQQAPSTEISDDDDDGYLNWNLVERHRSSITHTMATQKIDAEVMRNVPVSLQQTSMKQSKPLLNTRAMLDEEPPKTLRGMRNRQAAPTSDRGAFLGLQGRSARDSQSASEASA